MGLRSILPDGYNRLSMILVIALKPTTHCTLLIQYR